MANRARYSSGGGDSGGNIHLLGASYCWMKNVEADRSEGTSINFDGTFRCERRDSYVHSTVNPTPGGGGYGIGFNFYAADNLVENSIAWSFNKVMVMRASGGGNVIGYSYFDDGWIAHNPTYVESGLNASHYATAHMELFEGNRAWNFASDSTWGNSVYITAFRNHLTGLRGAIPPLGSFQYDYTNGASEPGVLYYEDLGARVGVAVGEGHWWNSFVGNVIGYAGMTPSNHPRSPGMGGQDRFVYEEKVGDYEVMPMWSIGFQDDGKQGPQDPVHTAAPRELRLRDQGRGLRSVEPAAHLAELALHEQGARLHGRLRLAVGGSGHRTDQDVAGEGPFRCAAAPVALDFRGRLARVTAVHAFIRTSSLVESACWRWR